MSCDHKNQNMKWEGEQIIHTCRLCHEVWYTHRGTSAAAQ